MTPLTLFPSPSPCRWKSEWPCEATDMSSELPAEGKSQPWLIINQGVPKVKRAELLSRSCAVLPCLLQGHITSLGRSRGRPLLLFSTPFNFPAYWLPHATPEMDTHPRIKVPYRQWLCPASRHCKAMSRAEDRYHPNQISHYEILTSENFVPLNLTGGTLACEVLVQIVWIKFFSLSFLSPYVHHLIFGWNFSFRGCFCILEDTFLAGKKFWDGEIGISTGHPNREQAIKKEGELPCEGAFHLSSCPWIQYGSHSLPIYQTILSHPSLFLHQWMLGTRLIKH